jgi:hypothetical protein
MQGFSTSSKIKCDECSHCCSVAEVIYGIANRRWPPLPPLDAKQSIVAAMYIHIRGSPVAAFRDRSCWSRWKMLRAGTRTRCSSIAEFEE